MAEIIRMPKMSDTMLEGVIANWLKKEGDVIKSGDIIAEVETDKATMELENYEDGTLLYIGVKVGEAVPVDGIIAIVGTPGEDYSALLAAPAAATSPAPAAEPAPVVKEAPVVRKIDQHAPPAEATEPESAEAPAEEPVKSRNSSLVDESARYGESLLREMLGAEPIIDKNGGK